MSTAPLRPLRIAHRGMPRRVRENTLEGFALAVATGADGVELDVHGTRDGVIVVHHDETIDGAEIAQLSWPDLAARAPYVPTLTAVSALLGQRVELFVELKGASIGALVDAVVACHDGAAAIHSFDHDAIRRLHESGSDTRLGILLDDGWSGDVASLMRATGACDVWPHDTLVTADLVAAVHAEGGRVLPWTVNDPARARALVALGVDGICTDDVGIMPA